jgi:fluoroacetyl-CoA thioesterase
MNAIPLGAKGSFSMTVAPEHLASRFKDPTLPPVLATPLMILFMENAALSAIREYLAPGESALGTVVNVRHLAATPAGQQVTAEAIVTGVEGRRIVFAVTARDETQEIGSGIHERALVDLRRLTERLDAKRDQQAGHRPSGDGA